MKIKLVGLKRYLFANNIYEQGDIIDVKDIDQIPKVHQRFFEIIEEKKADEVKENKNVNKNK